MITSSIIEPASEDLVALGRQVLQQEIEGLRALEQGLDASFAEAVELLYKVRGHVVLTGMGKSGIVARKIAATLASTGTPSFFIHPAEASHGDLGLITPRDAVIALSNSGNTKELHDILEYSRRLSLPLLAITRRAGTVLTELATLELVIPNTPEACINGLAPTTSTTMMMALGDALAIALLKRRNFSADDYRQFHPGGTLGRNLLRVEEFMHVDGALPLVRYDGDIITVIDEITTKQKGCVGVLNADGRLIGVITDGDVRRNFQRLTLQGLCAQDIMTPTPKVIRPKALLVEAVAKMNSYGITCLFAVDDHHAPQGLLHIHDCLKAGFR